MKKITRTLCMIAVVALAFTSCKKTEDTQTVKFNAVTEQLVEEGFEKVYLDANSNVVFEENDIVCLFDITPDGSTSAPYYVCSEGYLKGYMGASIPENTNGYYYAFYPGANVDASQLSAKNRATFELKAEQNDTREGSTLKVPKDALYMAAKDDTHNALNNTFFNFKNICGILSLKLYSTELQSVRKIEITDRHFNLVGKVSLNIPAVDPEYMTSLFDRYDESNSTYMTELLTYLNAEHLGYSVTDKSRTLTLDCGTTGVELGRTKAKATRFFIVMRPLALKEGCDIKIFFSDDPNDYYEINSSKDNMIRPNVIKNMAAVKVG